MSRLAQRRLRRLRRSESLARQLEDRPMRSVLRAKQPRLLRGRPNMSHPRMGLMGMKGVKGMMDMDGLLSLSPPP